MVTKTKLPGPFQQSWHAVSIAAGPVACPAAEGLRHKRFLSDEAPPNARRLGAANAFSAITQIVARLSAVGRRIAVGSRALGLGKRGARGSGSADGGRTISSKAQFDGAAV